MKNIRLSVLALMLAALPALAAKYMVTWIAPPSKIDTTVNVRIDFVITDTALMELTRVDSVTVRYGTQTGGGVPKNYPYKATMVFAADSALGDTAIDSIATVVGGHAGAAPMYAKPRVPSIGKRSLYISPRFQTTGGQKTMDVGKFYFIVCTRDSARFSQEAWMVVETKKPADLVSPKGAITTFQPTFQWKAVPGVPYYHVLLSDHPISLGDSNSISGASFIWQAITPGNSIRYGTPDPSGLFPAPPSLTPGIAYQWLVLNNYGNQKELTSINALPIPAVFTISGSLDGVYAPDTSRMKTYGQLRAGRREITLRSHESPGGWDRVDTFKVGSADSGRITLEWQPCTSSAFNLYKVYLFNVVFDSSTNSDAAVAVWTRNTVDTFVTLDAKSFLVDSILHLWKVIVENDRGAGISSHRKAFFYNDTAPQAKIRYQTWEKTGNDSTPIKFGAVSVTPLQGGGQPFDIPTNDQGAGSKTVQFGSYRVTASPAGFRPQVKDVRLVKDTLQETLLVFNLERLGGQVYGLVRDDSGLTVSDASITAYNSEGDTFSVNTDNSGSFLLGVTPGSWQIFAEKTAYQRSSPPIAVTVEPDSSRDIGVLNIARYTSLLSGAVRNLTKGSPIINAQVVLKRGGRTIATEQSGNFGEYSFLVEPGTGYELTASREGFSSASRTGISITANLTVDLALSSSTGYISGVTSAATLEATAAGSSLLRAPRDSVTVTAYNAASQAVGTAVSDRSSKSYFLTLSADTVTGYRLVFTGQNLKSLTVNGVRVRPDRTVILDTVLKALPSIKGKVLARDAGGVNQPVNVQVSGPSGYASATVTAAATGEFEIQVADTGAYRFLFSRSGHESDSASTSVKDSAGVLTSRNLPADSLVPGSVSIAFLAGLPAGFAYGDSSQQFIRFREPSPQSVTIKSVLTGMGRGSYLFGTTLTPVASGAAAGQVLLNVDSFRVRISVNDTVDFPLPVVAPVTAVPETAGIGGDSVRLIARKIDPAATVISSRLWFHARNGSSFDRSVPGVLSGDTLYFTLLPPADNDTMVYYIEVSAAKSGDTVKLTNFLNQLSTFIPPTEGLKYLVLDPMADSTVPAMVPWDSESKFRVTCKNGAFSALSPDSVRWVPEARNDGVTFGATEGAVLPMTVSKEPSISTARHSVLCRVYYRGRLDSARVYYQVAKITIDTLIIVSSGTEMASGGRLPFVVNGFNRDSTRFFPTRGDWKCFPSVPSPYGFSPDGDFLAPPNYIGTLLVQVSAFSRKSFMKLAIRHAIRPAVRTFAMDAVDSSTANLYLDFSGSVYPSGSGRDLYLESTDLGTLPLLQSVTAAGQVVTSSFALRLGTSNANPFQSPVGVYIRIPASAQGQELFAGVWNRRANRWDKIDSAWYASPSRSRLGAPLGKALAGPPPEDARWILIRADALGPVGSSADAGEYALLSMAEPFGINGLKVGPSPFSPFVTARDDLGKSWQGLRIEFEVTSNQSAGTGSEVWILNLEGTVIRQGLPTHTEDLTGFPLLNSLNTYGGFYGNRNKKRVCFWDGKNDHGRMCRNGRYLVRIMGNDGIKTEYRTVPVVLFK